MEYSHRKRKKIMCVKGKSLKKDESQSLNIYTQITQCVLKIVNNRIKPSDII